MDAHLLERAGQKVYDGRCHCGAIGFRFATAKPPSRWIVRACQCSFCKGHGAACTSDPAGSVSFVHSRESELQRYRFGLRTADFLLCRNCGVYIGAVIKNGADAFATLNIRAISEVHLDVPPPESVDYGQESVRERRRRRAQNWTPVVATV
jgi:hypothetical protein